MDVSIFLMGCAIVCFCFIVAKMFLSSSGRQYGKQLPGPKPWPIVGNALSVDFRHLHVSLYDFADKYGAIFQLNLAGKTVIVINDAKLLKKALGGDVYGNDFNHRPDTFFGKYLCFDSSDIGFGNANKTTMTMRKMFHRGLKFYGDGVDHFERNAEDETKRLLEELESMKEQDFDIYEVFKRSFANTTSSLMTGRAPEEDDHEIIWQFLDAGRVVIEPGMAFLYDLVPVLRLLPGPLGYTFRRAIQARDTFLQRFYTRLNITSSKSEEPGLVQALIRLQQEQNKNSSATVIGENNMKGLVVDLTFAGTETVTTVLANMFALLIVHPHVAKKIQNEVDTFVGNSRIPRLSDKENLSYTRATVYEVLRYTTSGGPLALPHRVKRDCTFEGFHVPKDSVILPNLWYIHHDPKFWKDPWKFQPERFLDAEGAFLPLDHATLYNFVAFSVGQRECPGKNLGRSRLFLTTATVLQSFDIISGSSGVLPDTDPRHYLTGGTIRVKDYLCRVRSRN